MPRYQYQCEACEYTLLVMHRMGESLEQCPECGVMDTMLRILPHLNFNNNKPEPEAGTIVKKSIDEARQAIKEEKRESSKEYKP